MSKGNIAIAYTLAKKRSKKCASGGMVKSGDLEMDYAKGGEVDKGDTEYREKGINKSAYGTDDEIGKIYGDRGISQSGHNVRMRKPEHAKAEAGYALEELKKMKGPHGNYAEGGEVDEEGYGKKEGHHHPAAAHHSKLKQIKDKINHTFNSMVSGKEEEPQEAEPERYSQGGMPYSEMEESKRPNMASGGTVACPNCGHQGLTDSGEQTPDHEMDMVSRAMSKRMSQGGKVANSDLPVADFSPNEFDDLHLRDGLEFSDTGASSGDEDGDPRSHEKDDLVSRAMLRKKAKR